VLRVFEFNLANYYKRNMRAFSTSIDLQGMDPSITRVEKDLCKDRPANQKQRHEFIFEELKNKNGLFVIDIQGNG